MSAEIALFRPAQKNYDGSDQEELRVTAFLGRRPGGEVSKSIQFSIGSEFTTLTDVQVEVLIDLLKRRLDGDITATGQSPEYKVDENGEIISGYL